MGEQLEKRDWHYLMPPSTFDVAPCACGNTDTQWSEFKDHLWCEKCQIDFVPEHLGILNGPVPVGLSRMLGISFDRVQIASGQVERFDDETLKYVPAT